MGHRVPNHKSKCRNLHGHRYVIEVGIDDVVRQTKGASDEGMVMDFGDLKEVMMQELDAVFDHGFVVSTDDPEIMFFEKLQREGQKIITVNFIPTAENLAKFWYGRIELPLRAKNIYLAFVKVWETPTSMAMYDKTND